MFGFFRIWATADFKKFNSVNEDSKHLAVLWSTVFTLFHDKTTFREKRGIVFDFNIFETKHFQPVNVDATSQNIMGIF